MALKSGIYEIRNTKSDKIYIGSSQNILKRWREHQSCLRNNCHGNSKLQNAWNKYGESIFVFTILETVAIENLLIREQISLDRLNPFYNICKIAGSNRGTKWSESAKEKFRHPKEQEHKNNMSKAREGRSYESLYGEQAQSIILKKSIKHLYGNTILKLSRNKEVLAQYSTYKEAYESINKVPGIGTNYIKKAIKSNKMYKKFYWQYL